MPRRRSAWPWPRPAHRSGRDALRPGAGPAVPRRALPAGAHRPRAADDGAPLGVRRLVVGVIDRGPGCALRRAARRRPGARAGRPAMPTTPQWEAEPKPSSADDADAHWLLAVALSTRAARCRCSNSRWTARARARAPSTRGVDRRAAASAAGRWRYASSAPCSASACSPRSSASLPRLVHRLSEQDDLVVGVASAGQAASGMPTLVGHCVNLLPVRVAIDRPGALRPAAAPASANTLLDAFDHQTLTYGTLLQKLPVPRDPSRLPLVSVMFNVDRARPRPTAAASPGCRAELSSTPAATRTSSCSSTLMPVADGLQLEAAIQHGAVRRKPPCGAGWACTSALLAPLVRQPLAPVRPARPAAPAEAATPSRCCSQHPRRCKARRCACETLIDAHGPGHARRCATAARRAVSYRELDQRANRLAPRPAGAGHRPGRPGRPVPARATPHMLVALLGMPEVRAPAYVPLDPAFPRRTHRLL